MAVLSGSSERHKGYPVSQMFCSRSDQVESLVVLKAGFADHQGSMKHHSQDVSFILYILGAVKMTKVRIEDKFLFP